MEDNARWYLAATNEVEQGNLHEPTWAKAIAIEQGDAKRAKYTYIQHRVKQFEQAMTGASLSAQGSLGPPMSLDAHQQSSFTPRAGRLAGDPASTNPSIKAIRAFNWGAALLPFLWSIFNTRGWYWVAAAIGSLIPGIGWLVTGIVFGFFGNRWSWATKDWDSFEKFQHIPFYTTLSVRPI